MCDNLYPIRSHGEESSCNDAVIESPFYNFEGREAEENLSNKANVESIVNIIFSDIVIVGKCTCVAIEESEANGITESSQTINKEVQM